MVRTPVGDRYVVEHMRKHGYNVGGEQSGHIVLSDFTTTGDGLVAALQVLAVVVGTGKPVSEVCKRFEPLPQILENVRYANGAPLEHDAVQAGDRPRRGSAWAARAGSSSARPAPSPSSASWPRATTSAWCTRWWARSSRPCARLRRLPEDQRTAEPTASAAAPTPWPVL